MKQYGVGRSASALFVLTLSLYGCASEPASDPAPAESGPSAAVRQFYDRLNAGDHAAAIELYSSEARGMVVEPSGSTAGFSGWAEVETKGRTVVEVRVVSTAEHAGGGGADVQFEVRYRDGTSATRQVSVMQEGGAWKLGFIS